MENYKNYLRDLDQNINIKQMGLYWIRRYKYNPSMEGVWVGPDGKRITEPVYSFVLMRGKEWFNQTHFNATEKEFNNVLPTYEKFLEDITKKRREKLTLERQIRKQLPVKHDFIFKNVTITAVESPCYYRQGYPSTRGTYFEPKEKIIDFYANGRPYRSNKVVCIDTIVDTDFILENTITNGILHHYSKETFTRQYVKNNKVKLKYPYTPLIGLIGYVYEFEGNQYEIYDFGTSCFRGVYFKIQNQKELQVSLSKFMSTAKPVAELQGDKQWVSLLNKYKYAS